MEFKDSYLALDRLHSLYRKLDDDERAMAEIVLSEWALSEDEGLRFDALAMIKDFRIAAALPMLRKLADRLFLSKEPGAPYELKKVNRIISALCR